MTDYDNGGINKIGGSMEYKVGDRVRGKEGRLYISGKEGKIIYEDSSTVDYDYDYDYAVEFDDPIIAGHSCEDKGKLGYCRWVNDEEIESIPPYFDGILVGDTVYSMGYGEAKVTDIDVAGDSIRVNTSNGWVFYFTFKGVSTTTNYGLQTVFWSKPVFDLPPPPKRMVKKVVEGWFNIYPTTYYESEGAANQGQSKGRLGKAHFIHHEYEVEE